MSKQTNQLLLEVFKTSFGLVRLQRNANECIIHILNGGDETELVFSPVEFKEFMKCLTRTSAEGVIFGDKNVTDFESLDLGVEEDDEDEDKCDC